MIVQPNFLDHWKTRLLQVELGGDQLSPCYVLRLWGHCQVQKTHRFPKLSASALAAICHFNGAPEVFWLAMQNSGFVVVKSDVLEVHQWKEYNSGLITSWNNGKKGGRKKNPRVTRKEPTANQNGTHGGDDREDKIDKIREDSNTIAATAANGGESPKSEAQETPKPRPRNPLIDALAFIAGIPLREIGPTVGSRLGKALSTIKQSTPEVTAEEITRRATNYRSHYPKIALTPEALAKHWGVCHETLTGPAAQVVSNGRRASWV